MNNQSVIEKMKGLRKCYFGFFAIFGSYHSLLFFDNASMYAMFPIISYFLFFVIGGLFLLKAKNKKPEYYFFESVIMVFFFVVYSMLSLLLSLITIQAKSLYDIHSAFSLVIIGIFILGYIVSKFLVIENDFREVPDKIKIRGSEIEIKSMNFWSELSLSKAPWLEKPLKSIKYGVGYFIIFVGGSASGLSLAAVEGLERSEILGSDINPHAFLFFVFGVPVALISGIVLYPLFSYLFRWRKLTKEIKREYGSYTLLLNLDNKPYSQLKSEIENDH